MNEENLILNETEVRNSNLDNVIALMCSNGLTDYTELVKGKNALDTLAITCCFLGSKNIAEKSTEGYMVIDLPSLGYRLDNVIVSKNSEHGPNVLYTIVSFRLVKIYHVISYKNSTDGVLSLFNHKNKGYTRDLRVAGIYTEEDIKHSLDYYHNGNNVCIRTNKLYSHFTSAHIVDYMKLPELDYTVSKKVLEVSDMGSSTETEKSE
jgi:hypothetical protein